MDLEIKNLLETKKPTDLHDPNNIYFHDANMPYNILANDYTQSPIIIDGITYKTPEHYYQSQLFDDPVTINRILNAETSNMAKQIANRNDNLMVQNIDKNSLMLDALRAKFSQHWELGADLMSLKGKNFVNHDPYDLYWGDGGDGSGLNTLGKLISQVRDELISGSLSLSDPFRG